jgi:hypothetical protein
MVLPMSATTETSHPHASVVEVFRDLGDSVAKAWSLCRYDASALPEIAASAMSDTPLHRSVEYPALLRWVASTEAFSPQPNIASGFGEPPLTLYWHPTFYIEALFWCTSTTSIHGHGFSGAFQVLAGSSVQSLYAFEPDVPGLQRCRLGRLRQTSAALLRPGSTQQILGGERFIHSVFHLGYPSVTIVVRTFVSDDRAQYHYHRPGTAVALELTFDQLTRRLLQVARLQARLQSPDLHMTVEKIAATCDLAAAFTLLRDLTPILRAQNRPDVVMELILTLGGAHGLPSISRLAEAVAGDDMMHPLTRARDTVVDEDLRLFLALLLTQQGRRFMMPLAAEYTGEADPSAKIAAWICELGARDILTIPSDVGVEGILSRWLQEGRPTAAPMGSADQPTGVDFTRIVESLRVERLLAPLLSEGSN